MVALVRAGVTATCSSADRPRYGDLTVDSNLPDARIALGGPDQNDFTAAVLAEADPVYTEELKRQLYTSGAARVWVPPVSPLAEQWVPGADLRGVRALPVLIVAGADLDAAVAAVVEDLADFEIVVTQDAASELEPFEAQHRRRAQPRDARLRGRVRRHAAHVVDAVVHRLAVRHVDRPAAAHRTGRLELPIAALDAHLRLRAGLRRRRLATGGYPRPQRRVFASAVGRRRKHEGGRRVARMGITAARSNPPARWRSARSRPRATRWRPAAASNRSVGRCRGPAGRNIRYHNRCRRPLWVASNLRGGACRPARTATGAAACSRRAHGARL